MSQASVDLNGPFHSNWDGLSNPLSQPITSKQPIQLTSQTITLETTLEEILRNISAQVFETKYVINFEHY
jgi:hypothetical protein